MSNEFPEGSIKLVAVDDVPVNLPHPERDEVPPVPERIIKAREKFNSDLRKYNIDFNKPKQK